MGIPVGWNIVRDEAKEKDVLRGDVSGTRSPIRRRARGGRPASSRRDAGAFDTDALVASPSRFAAVEHAPRLSHARTQLPPAERRDESDHEAEDRAELDRVLDRVAQWPHGAAPHRTADGERPLPALTPGFAPAGPRPHEDDLFAVLRQHQRERRALEASLEESAARDGDGDDWTSGRSRRVPSRATPPPNHERASLSWTSARRHTPYARAARRSDTQPEDNPFAAPSAVSHPPLRRVGHRRIADGPLPASSLRESWPLDGLGDRERSNSLSSTSSNLPWQTFLTTVVPDPVAPTAESSFASAAASASFTASSSRASSSNSAASEHTHLTVPSRHGSSRPSLGLSRTPANDAFPRACESDSDSNNNDNDDEDDASTASDTDDEAAANPLIRRRMRPTFFADAPPLPHPRRHGRSVADAGSSARGYVRRYYADADARVRQAQREEEAERDGEVDSFSTVADVDDAPTHPDRRDLDGEERGRDQELRDARSLLLRLTERGDVGDEFWASVGLLRSFADGVERVERRGL